MSGFIKEKNFDECEEAFPGIVAFYNTLATKPRTFLDLVASFMKESDESPAALAPASTGAI